MNKDKNRQLQLKSRTLSESLTFQTMWGARQMLPELTPEIETRINEELLVLNNLQLAEDMLALKKAVDGFSKDLGIKSEPSKGILAGSIVAFCLGLEPTNPFVTEVELNPMDFKIPLQLTISYDNEVRNKVVDWLKEHNYTMTTYLGQPLLKLLNTRVLIRRVVK